MKYNFDQVINRRNTESVKWDVKSHELPMWIADMDFPVPDELLEVIEQKVQQRIFEYTCLTDEWYQNYQDWWLKRYSVSLEKEWLVFCAGIVPGIASILRALGNSDDKVVLLTPVYNAFFYAIHNSDHEVVECPMDYVNHQYAINFERLEKELKKKENRFLIVCNPHNPTGNIWSKEDLEKIYKLANENDVIVISDEIHCDITEPGYTYIPYITIDNKNCICCAAPTKAFNLAGLKSSCLFIPNEEYRNKIQTQLNKDSIGAPNAFSITATKAYQVAEEWLNEMREYVFENRAYANEYIQKEIPLLSTVPSHSTYLLWIDISKTNLESEEFYTQLRKETGLYLNVGESYGKMGITFMRLNLACPRSILEDGLKRLKEFCKILK